ncbi:MAG: cellulose-binding protein [Candidatus Thiodiazotropha lotti]|nr:cellulose-binding protein [Candidatus Thiodiazotropha lotti]
MDAIAQYFDHYVINARVKPALFVVLPLAVTIMAWWPEAQHLGGATLTVMATFGVIAFLSNLISNYGNELQAKLFSEWGGAPTTALLRFADVHLDRNTKERYHMRLEKMIPNLKMPSDREEQQEPMKADSYYISATNYLREHTRDKERFPMVYSDNVAYGYARNLLAMKPLGISVAVLGLVANSVLLFLYHSTELRLDYPHSFQVQLAFGIGTVAVCLVMLWLFVRVVNGEYVKGRAVRYAKSLLAVCENSSVVGNE